MLWSTKANDLPGNFEYKSSWIYENDIYNLGAWVLSLLSIKAG